MEMLGPRFDNIFHFQYKLLQAKLVPILYLIKERHILSLRFDTSFLIFKTGYY